MPKADKKAMEKASQLRHDPLDAAIRKPAGKLKEPKAATGKKSFTDDDEMYGGDDDNEQLPEKMKKKLYTQARYQREEEGLDDDEDDENLQGAAAGSDDEDEELDEEDEGEQLVNLNGEFVEGVGLSAAEEAVVSRFLNANRAESRSLADIIMDKIRMKEESGGGADGDEEDGDDMYAGGSGGGELPPKVVEVYSSVGKMLRHYTAGKLPKALKMLPHLRSWEEVLWLTRPDEWSPVATFACTRIFASNLNAKMAQRFFNVVLLEKVRDDIKRNSGKLNYHLYMALKKALFKPAAFYKGLLLPLALSRTCTLREATIIGSVISKVSVPANHSAAALLKLAEMPYFGSTSFFIRVFINKRYALPRRVLDALMAHFAQFQTETRDLPLVWHQALLAFVQRYKFELTGDQRETMKALLKVQSHHLITPEIRRELFAASAGAGAGARPAPSAATAAPTDDMMLVR